MKKKWLITIRLIWDIIGIVYHLIDNALKHVNGDKNLQELKKKLSMLK